MGTQPNQAGAREASATLEGVDGWLLFLCVALTVLAPIFTAIALYPEWSELSGRPELLSVVIAETVFSAATAILGIGTGTCLWLRLKNAVRIAISFFVLLMVASMVQPFAIAAIARAHGFGSAAADALTQQGLQGSVRAVVAAVIWIAYLLRSKRVRATYGS